MTPETIYAFVGIIAAIVAVVLYYEHRHFRLQIRLTKLELWARCKDWKFWK